MKITYDVTNVENTSGDFKQPKTVLYPAKVFNMEARDSRAGNPMLEVQFDIVSGEFKGSRLWHYVMLDGSAEWRMVVRQLDGIRDRSQLAEQIMEEYGYWGHGVHG